MQRIYRNIDTQPTGVLIQAGQSFLTGWALTNTGGSAVFVKLYDTATAPDATQTPIATIALPANTHSTQNGNDGPQTGGVVFQRGMGIRATTLVADSDATAPSANQVVVNLLIDA
jgi:hypothetical protein